jgi:hypothetical protein
MLSNLKYLLYRCYKCGRVITKLDIQAIWSIPPPPKGCNDHVPLCPCGSRHVSPSNAKLWEELILPRIWKLWWYEVVLPWWKNR